MDGIFRTEPEDVDATANGDSANNAMINAGEDVYVFVFDSGIDSTHIEFNHNSSDNRVKCPFNAFKFDYDSQPDSNNDINYAEDHICYDKNGHGTYTAGIIGGYTYGVAKAVQLVSIKITKNNEDTTSIGALIAGIDYVISLQQRNVTENMPIVLNFSLGGPPKIAFKMAIDIAIEHGMIVVASAGNHDNENDDDGGTGVVPSACSRSPANMDNVITVGSTNQNDERAQFSNTGECLTLYAPGHAITSSHSGSTTKTLSAEEEQNVVFDSKAAGANNKYITRSGTSASAAYVAGALALYLQYNPDMSSHEAKNWLTSSAIKHITIDGGTLLILNIQPIQDI